VSGPEYAVPTNADYATAACNGYAEPGAVTKTANTYAEPAALERIVSRRQPDVVGGATAGTDAAGYEIPVAGSSGCAQAGADGVEGVAYASIEDGAPDYTSCLTRPRPSSIEDGAPDYASCLTRPRPSSIYNGFGVDGGPQKAGSSA